MNNTTVDIIERYLKSDHIPYAILLDGKWGTGKTWYINFHKKIVYTSANGISSLEDISIQIIYRSVIGKSNFGWKITKLAHKLIPKLGDGFLKDTKDFVSLNKNQVLIIDDVERMNHNISMEDFLGYISTNFTEENGIKVILVADEEKLLEKLGDKEKEYLSIKEKTIWQTIEYNLDTENVYDDIIKSYSNNTIDLLERKKKYLIPLFKQHKVVNLRWILYYFQILNDIVEEEKGFFDDDKRELVLSTILILCLEYKKGRLTSRLEQDMPKYIKNIYSPRVYPTGNISAEKSELMKFRKEYGDSYYFFESLYKFVCFGLLEINELKQEVEIYEQAETKPWSITLKRLIRFLDLEEDEFKEHCKKLIEYVKEGKYGLYRLLHIAIIFEVINSCDLKFNLEKVEFYGLLSKKINEVKVLSTSNDNILFPNYMNVEFSEEYKELNSLYKAVESKIKSNASEKHINEQINDGLEKLEKSEKLDSAELIALIENGTDNQINQFSKLATSSTKNMIILINTFPYDIEKKVKLEQNLKILVKRLSEDSNEKSIIKIRVKEFIKKINTNCFDAWEEEE